MGESERQPELFPSYVARLAREFPVDPTYPEVPGWKEPTTSRAAAAAAAPAAPKQRAAVLAAITAAAPEGLTADEAGSKCGLTPFSARPRVTELVLAGEIVDTGARRKNASGRKAKVYRVKRIEP